MCSNGRSAAHDTETAPLTSPLTKTSWHNCPRTVKHFFLSWVDVCLCASWHVYVRDVRPCCNHRCWGQRQMLLECYLHCPALPLVLWSQHDRASLCAFGQDRYCVGRSLGQLHVPYNNCRLCSGPALVVHDGGKQHTAQHKLSIVSKPC